MKSGYFKDCTLHNNNCMSEICMNSASLINTDQSFKNIIQRRIYPLSPIRIGFHCCDRLLRKLWERANPDLVIRSELGLTMI